MPRFARDKPTSNGRRSTWSQLRHERSLPREVTSTWRGDPRLWSLAIILITCLAFAPAFTCDFSNIDDPGTLSHNPRLNPPTLASVMEFWNPRKPAMDLYVPVTYTFWAVLARLAYLPEPDAVGIHLNPWLFHGANVALHALSAVFVLQVLRLLGSSTPIAAAGAMLFALHPVQVEAVGWTSGTKDLLCGLFSLIALWGYLKFAIQDENPNRAHSAGTSAGTERTEVSCPFRSRWYWIGTAALALALLAKPTAVVTPLVAAAIDVLVLRRRVRDVGRALWPWMLLVIPTLIEGRLAQPAHHPGDFVVPVHLRPLIATDALAFYVWKLVWPANLCSIYNRAPQAVIDHGWLYWTWPLPLAIGLAVFVPLAFGKRRTSHARRLAAAVVIFILGVLPMLGLVPFDFQQFSTVSDHYLYLAMLGPALAGATAIAALLRVRPRACHAMVPILCCTLLAALGIRSFFQCRHWHDSFSILEHDIRVNPWQPSLYDNLSLAWIEERRPDEALRCDEESVRRWPYRAASHANLAADLGALNRLEEAEAQYQAALRVDPAFKAARHGLADIKRLRESMQRSAS